MSMVRRLRFKFFHVWEHKDSWNKTCCVCGQYRWRGLLDFTYYIGTLGDVDAHHKVKICI